MLIFILVLIILGLLSLNIAYRYQIKKISEQVEFITKVNTNKVITPEINFKEINDLITKLNKLVSDQKEMNLSYSIKEKELRESITNISHDIRTPLTSLNGYFQLLIETDNQEDKDRYTYIIQSRIDILKNLLDDMFTYIKIQDSNYKMEEETINLNNIIQENLLSYYDAFNLKEIEPIISLPNRPIMITTNKVSLNRIINNIISNTLIHGNNFISVNLYKKDNVINITFENDVENEEKIDLENIFNRFYKTDYARTDTSTGLGLAIVKELVENMNGKIIASIIDDVFKIHITLTLDK